MSQGTQEKRRQKHVKNHHMKHFLLLQLLVFFLASAFSQDLGMQCGEQCSEVDHDFENWLALRTAGNRESSNFVKYVPVAFHVFDGASGVDQVEEAFAILQEQMVGSNIIPCRHQTNFYNSYDSLETEHPVYDNPLYYQAMQANEISGTPATDVCNIYVFGSVGAGIAGFSWINNNPSNIVWDGIYMKGEWLASNVITHEMGHYCGLYHTFNGGSCNSVEANCEEEGDRVCDTPPTSANLSCESPYCSTADYTNHMDYTPNYCRDHFTYGQIERMHMMLVNGGRSSVWESGLCSDPNLLDVGVLDIENTNRCDENYTPTVRLSNYTNIDAEGVELSVVINNQQWDTIVNVPAQTIMSVTGPALMGEYLEEYVGEAYIFMVGDNIPENNVNTFNHNPLPLAVLNIDIQHDWWPESEQWKVYKEGAQGSFATGTLYYARGGSWGIDDTYDSFTNGMTNEPYFTHDEICLTGGCYNGFFRHAGYARTQEVFGGGLYEGIVCGVDFYVERGLETDTLYSYHRTAFGPNGEWNWLGEGSTEWNWGWHHGPSSEHVYDYCVEDIYYDLIEPSDPTEDWCMGDFDGDGSIDLMDLLSICTEMGKEGGVCICDTDGDNDVDTQDFLNFITVYGTDCEGNELAPPTLREFELVAERDGLKVKYYDLNGRSVIPHVFGIYLAEVEVNGMKIYTKVVL